MTKKPGRNEPCWCGSGKKYKVCHAGEDRAQAAQKPPARPSPLDALLQGVEPPDAELTARVTQEAKERAAWVEAALRQPGTPSVFAPEEQVWLTCVLWEPLQALKGQGLGAEARREAIRHFLHAAKGALDADFLSAMVERMRAKSKDATLPEAERTFFREAAVAFEAEPVRMTLAAVLTARGEPVARSAEEQVVLADMEAKTRWTAEDLEPLRALLESQGHTGPAERLRRAQEWLRAHRVELPEPPSE